jgi:hypothetical protein
MFVSVVVCDVITIPTITIMWVIALVTLMATSLIFLHYQGRIAALI